MTVRIELGGIVLELLPGRVAYRPDTATLFVADMHLGKSGTFRAHGVPVPESSTLVPGNHDLHTKDLDSLELTIAAEDGEVDGLRLRHEPDPKSISPMLSGHVHPVAILGTRGGPHLRTRCFHVKNQTMTLPAFGSFTGGFEINWNDGALFAAGEQEVIPLNPQAKEMSVGTPQDPR